MSDQNETTSTTTGTDAKAIESTMMKGHQPKTPTADDRKAAGERFSQDFSARMKQDGQARTRSM